MGHNNGGDAAEVERLKKEVETLNNANQEMSRLMEVSHVFLFFSFYGDQSAL
jgi:hypothetical protein